LWNSMFVPFVLRIREKRDTEIVGTGDVGNDIILIEFGTSRQRQVLHIGWLLILEADSETG
jgi:hypothetical protein